MTVGLDGSDGAILGRHGGQGVAAALLETLVDSSGERKLEEL